MEDRLDLSGEFRILRGVFLNPLKIQSPRAEPVPRAERAAFEATRDRVLALLERVPAADVRMASASR